MNKVFIGKKKWDKNWKLIFGKSKKKSKHD